jgi:hypothetical protein
MAEARHFHKLPTDQVRISSPCWTLSDETLELIDKAADQYSQSRSRIVQAAIRFKAAQLKGKYQGIRLAFECFKNYDLPKLPKPKFYTPSLFDDDKELLP